MLDEEVVFAIDRRVPKNKGLESVLGIAGTVSVISGSVAGYFGALNGLGFNKFWSFVFGGAAGLGASLGLTLKVGDAIETFRQSNYDKKQQALDEKALSDNAETITFSYRDNDLQLVIRPEYEDTGNVFYMHVNDGLLRSPKFSYQPKRDAPLKFSFEIPDFVRPKKPDTLKLCEIRTHATLSGLNPNDAIQEYISEIGTDNKAEVEYVRLIRDILKPYQEKLGSEEKLDVIFFREGKRFGVRVEYSGENFGTRLALFSRCSNELMNKAYEFRMHKRF